MENNCDHTLSHHLENPENPEKPLTILRCDCGKKGGESHHLAYLPLSIIKKDPILL